MGANVAISGVFYAGNPTMIKRHPMQRVPFTKPINLGLGTVSLVFSGS